MAARKSRSTSTASPADPATSSAPVSSAQSANAPIPLSPEAEVALHQYLSAARQSAEADLAEYKGANGIKLWRDMYEGNIKPAFKPFKDASEVYFPLAKMVADSSRSRMHRVYLQQREPVIVESMMQESDYARLTGGKSLSDHLHAARRFINKMCLDEDELDVKTRFDAIFDEITQVGSTFIRAARDLVVVPKKKMRGPNNTVVVKGSKKAPVVISDRISIKTIPIERCFWDTTADDHTELRIRAYDFDVDAFELESLALQQKWSAAHLKTIKESPDYQFTDAVAAARQRERVQPSSRTMPPTIAGIHTPVSHYTLTEVWLVNRDVDGDGAVEDVVILWHPRTGAIPRVVLFPYDHNQPALHLLHYEQRRNRNIARGAIEPLVSIAAGANNIANQAIDAQTIRNCPNVVGPEDSDVQRLIESQGWTPGQFYPEREKGEVHVLEFGQTGNTVVSMGIFTELKNTAFQLAHLGPAQFGDVSTAQRAATDLGSAIMMEGNILHDRIVDVSRPTLSRVLWQCFALYVQCQPEKIAAAIGPEDAEKVMTLINTVGLEKLKVTLTMASATHSRELDRRNLIALSQFLSVTHRQTGELVAWIVGGVGPDGKPMPGNPHLAKPLTKILRSVETLMKYIVESYPNMPDAEPFVPNLASDVEEITEAAAAPAAIPLTTPGISVPPANPGPGAGVIG